MRKAGKSIDKVKEMDVTFSQEAKTDSTKTKEIAEVTLIAKKPTVESKVDRTVFNVANSSVLPIPIFSTKTLI